MNKSYDQEQLKAIRAHHGYYLVLASPGCGKTDILSERIVKAREQGISFDDMLCLTFTNRASRGMKNRVMEKVGEDAKDIFVGNVHRYCSNFLFANAIIPQNTAIIDEEDMGDILMELDSNFFLTSRSSIDKNKLNAIDNMDVYFTFKELKLPQHVSYLPESYESFYKIAQQADFDPSRIDSLHKIVAYTLLYRQYKKEHHMISFSDILVLTYHALLRDSNHELKRYRWIQVDEVQDLNALQVAIIDELTNKDADFTVMYLGDDQQAIFSFLGAKAEQLNLLRERCSQEGHMMTLGKNYRSPKYLLDVFNLFAEKELHVPHELLPQPVGDDAKGPYDLILAENNSAADEESRVTKMVKHYLSLSDHERVAVLVPTNAVADRISANLNKKGLAHFKISGTDMFKTHSYKTLSSFFAAIANNFNSQAWARLIYGVNALATQALARRFVVKLQNLMMTPADLFAGKTYLETFNEVYENREMVFFDTETTGLNVFEDDIVQIAAFKVFKGEKVTGSDFNILLHTDRPIPEKLGDIVNPLIEAYQSRTHYSREEGLQLFLDYIGECPVLGHNVMYDYQILQHNVERTLHKKIKYEVYDSLYLIKCVAPNMRRYKLEFLLKELGLEGKNSHLADEDIAATKAVVDYCYHQAHDILPQQKAFLSHPQVANIVQKMQVVRPLFDDICSRLYLPVNASDVSIANELRIVYERMIALKFIDNLGSKFDTFLRYAQIEWGSQEVHETLNEQIQNHINDLTSSISEGDLINSSDIVKDRVFIMTVYKGKGLEFDNVIILGACDGTYPFFTVNQVLEAPQRHSIREITEAQRERQEDARKFYVALSRAKKRICVSYSLCNSYGRSTRRTPFMDCIAEYFYTGKR